MEGEGSFHFSVEAVAPSMTMTMTTIVAVEKIQTYYTMMMTIQGTVIDNLVMKIMQIKLKENHLI